MSKEYLNLIRNYKNFSWLITYLFGFSPICNKDFLSGRYNNLKEFSKNVFTYHQVCQLGKGLGLSKQPTKFNHD